MENNAPSSPPFAVYFDGSCPLCQREIGFYRGMRGAEAIDWVDVSAGNAPLPGGLDCQLAMKRFHVRGRDGRVRDGAPAFIALWKQLPSTRALGRVAGLPVVRHIAAIAYEVFLKIRPSIQKVAVRLEGASGRTQADTPSSDSH